MVLVPLMTLVGRHFMMQRRVFLVGKKDLESMSDESGFGDATEMGGFKLDKGPEVSLVSETFWKSIFTSSASVVGSDKRSLLIKLPNNFNNRDTTRKGTTKLPDCLHKGLLDEIIRRSALEFIDNDWDEYQEE